MTGLTVTHHAPTCNAPPTCVQGAGSSGKTGVTDVRSGASGKQKPSDEARMQDRISDRFGANAPHVLLLLPNHVTSETR